MTSIADQLGFGPRRVQRQQPNGTWIIEVTPPFRDAKTVSVKLTAAQHERYERWRAGRYSIQDMLPDLSDSEREKLMSGLDDADFKEYTGEKVESRWGYDVAFEDAVLHIANTQLTSEQFGKTMDGAVDALIVVARALVEREEKRLAEDK